MMLYCFECQSIFSQTLSDRDVCNSWVAVADNGPGALIYFRSCEISNGSDGYFEIKNENENGVHLDYVINFVSGSSIQGSADIPLDDKKRFECSHCVIKDNEGVLNWQISNVTLK